MGVFFTDDEEKFILRIEEMNRAFAEAKTALEYTSTNDKHLVEFYRQTLSSIAAKFRPDLILELYADKNQIGVNEVPSHILNRLNNE